MSNKTNTKSILNVEETKILLDEIFSENPDAKYYQNEDGLAEKNKPLDVDRTSIVLEEIFIIEDEKPKEKPKQKVKK